MPFQSRGRSRGLIIGSLAAGVFIVLALVVFGPRSTKPKIADNAPLNSRLLDQKIPERDPSQRVVISKDRDPGADPFASLQTGRGELEFTNDQGILALRYRWDKSTPLKGGWNEFQAPRAWVYQSPQRLIYVTADNGRFQVADNRQPQAGVLNGHVVVSLFEARGPGQSVYPVDPTTATPAARFETSSMDFDLVRMLGRTDERVVILTPNVIVAGTGMELLFNEKGGRIEKLDIRDRELIAYRAPTGAPDSQATGNNVQSPADPVTGANSVASAPPEASAPNAQATAPGDSRTVYQLILSDEVIIDQGSPDNHTTITGRELTSYFAAGKNDLKGRLATAFSPLRFAQGFNRDGVRRASVTGPESFTTLPAFLASTVIAAPSVSGDLHFLGNDGALSDGDVVITGTGSLLLTPQDKPVGKLQGNDDVYALLSGSPVRIENGDAYAFGSAIEYSRAGSSATLLASPQQPLEAGITGGARLTSVYPFTYNIENHSGYLNGAGNLVGLRPDLDQDQARQTNPQDQAPKRSAGGLPTGFLVSWMEGFGVQFKPDSGGGLGKIAAATFDGNVHVNDPMGYSLDSGSLRIGFRDETDEHVATIPGEEHAKPNNPVIDTITAKTNARLLSADGNVNGDELFVQFKPDADGQAVPEQMTITGNGRIVTADGTLESQYIQADLVEKSLALDQAMSHVLPGNDAVALKRLIAQGAVFMHFADGVTASADRLVADAVADLTTLTGNNVVVADPTMEVIGQHVEVDHLFDQSVGRVARVIGPGTMAYWQTDESQAPLGKVIAPAPATDQDLREQIQKRLEKTPTGNGDRNPDSPAASTGRQNNKPQAQKMDVKWNGGLTFDETPGLATFTGNVVASSKPNPFEIDSMAGDWMRIELTGKLPIDQPDNSIGDGSDRPGSARRLQKLTVIGQSGRQARLDAQRFADEQHTRRELLVAVAGDVLEYTDPTETFKADGPGWMLVVDNRQDRAPTSNDDRNDDVQFSGPGETEFTFGKDLTLDGVRGELLFNEGVIMRHRPAGQPVMRMDCDTLRALFEQGGDLGPYDLSSRNGLDLAVAIASGSVFVKREDRNIWADRITFDKKRQRASLEALGDSAVVIETESTGTTVYARKGEWNLADDSVTAQALRADSPAPIINPP